MKLARTQRRVALAAIEERVGGSLLDLPDALVRAAHLGAMRAVADAALRFDPFAKGRLAGRAAVALAQALSLTLRDRAPSRAGARRAQTREVRLADWTRGATPWGGFACPGPRLVDWLRANPDNEDARLLALAWAKAPQDARGRGIYAGPGGGACTVASARRGGLNPTPRLRRRYPAAR